MVAVGSHELPQNTTPEVYPTSTGLALTGVVYVMIENLLADVLGELSDEADKVELHKRRVEAAPVKHAFSTGLEAGLRLAIDILRRKDVTRNRKTSKKRAQPLVELRMVDGSLEPTAANMDAPIDGAHSA